MNQGVNKLISHILLTVILGSNFLLPAKSLANTAGDFTADPHIEEMASRYENNKTTLSEEALHSLDTFKLLNQKIIRGEKQEKFAHLISLRGVDVDVATIEKISLSIQNGGFEEIEQRITEKRISDPQSMFESIAEQGAQRVTLSYQGREFHQIEIKASQIINHNQVIFFKTSEGIYFLNLVEFKNSLGKSEIPLFKLPVDAELLSKDLELKEGKLKLGEIPISSELIKIYTDAQRIAFRITANMVDPSFHSDALPVIEAFKEYFKLSLQAVGKNLEEQGKSVADISAKVVKLQEEIQKDLKLQQELASKHGELTEDQKNELLKKFAIESVERLEKDLAQGEELKNKYEQASSTLQTNRKLTTRLHWIWARMSMPTPNASKTIKEALTLVQKTLVYKNIQDMKSTFDSFEKLSKDGIKLAQASVVAYFGMKYQVELSTFFYQSLDMTRAILNSVFGEFSSLKNSGYTAGEAIKSMGDSLNPFTVKEAYFNQEILPKLGIAMTAMISTLYAIIGTPHIVVNSIKLYKDLKAKHLEKFIEMNKKNGQKDNKAKFNAYIQTYFSKKHFIERQNEENKKYLNILASAHAQGKSTDFTEEDNRKVEEIIKDLEEKERQNRGMVVKFFSKLNIMKYIKKESSEIKSSEITTFPKALRSFIFSYAAFTQTGYVYTTIWNNWFVFRSFVLRPSTWYTFLAYPNYYDKMVRPVDVKVLMPTKFNGGLLKIASMRASKFEKETLSLWENKVFSLEEKVHNEAIKKAFLALSENVKSDTHLQALLEEGSIKSIYDKRIGQLKKKQQIYFQNIFQSLFNRSMETLLKQVDLVSNEKVFDIRDAKNFTIEDIQRLDEITNVEKVVDKIWDEKRVEINMEAQGKVKDAFIRPSMRTLHDSVATERVRSTNKHGKNPLRMAQAVRYMIAKNLVDKPMELLFMFVGLAAIQTSGLGQELIRPIQDAMFSENSWFYLSRYTFLNGYLAGVVMGVMADVWYKLQVGENFKSDIAEVPEGEHAKKSYIKWYFHKMADKENTWWGNQKHFIKIVYANMPAAIVTYLGMNLITLGRFDIDAYLIGYMAAYLLPTNGLNFKLENGFELASGYFFKDIPERFRSHPAIQEFTGKMAHNKRLVFNLIYTTYENLMGVFLLTFENMETERMGTRSLSRSLFGGWTVTEKIAETAEKVKVGIEVSSLPGKEGLMKTVDILCKPFTNNFTDWSKFTPKQ